MCATTCCVPVGIIPLHVDHVKDTPRFPEEADNSNRDHGAGESLVLHPLRGAAEHRPPLLLELWLRALDAGAWRGGRGASGARAGAAGGAPSARAGDARV